MIKFNFFQINKKTMLLNIFKDFLYFIIMFMTKIFSFNLDIV